MNKKFYQGAATAFLVTAVFIGLLSFFGCTPTPIGPVAMGLFSLFLADRTGKYANRSEK